MHITQINQEDEKFMRNLFNSKSVLKVVGVLVVAGGALPSFAQNRGGYDRGGYETRGSVTVDLADRDRCMRSRSDREEVDCFRDITAPRNNGGGGGGGGRSSCTTISLCVDTDTTLTLTNNYINATNASTLAHYSCPAHLNGYILIGLGADERAISNTSLPMSLPFRGSVESFQKLSGRGRLEGSVDNGVLKVTIKDDSRGAGVYTINVCTGR